MLTFILMSGSRFEFNEGRIAWGLENVLKFMPSPVRIRDLDITLFHGDAEGADKTAKKIAESWGWSTAPFTCTKEQWRRHGHAAGCIRNQEMVDALVSCMCSDIQVGFVAFPKGKSKGTRDCIERVIATRKVPALIVPEWRREKAGEQLALC